jgi:hypothetical protein
MTISVQLPRLSLTENFGIERNQPLQVSLNKYFKIFNILHICNCLILTIWKIQLKIFIVWFPWKRKVRPSIEKFPKSIFLTFFFISAKKMWLFKRDNDYKAFANERDEKFSILKNVFLISFGFTLLFTAYNSAAALQSSVNKVRGIFNLRWN